jgi:hypothetical protein
LNSAQRGKIDQVLDGLGDVPVNLGRLIERHVGRIRITASEADSLLTELGEPIRGQPQELRAGSLKERQGLLRHDIDRGQNQDQDGQDRDRGQEKEAEPQQFVAASFQPESAVAARSTESVTTQAGASSSPESTLELAQTTESSVSRRPDARDLRYAPNLRKTTFTDRLTGLDDLPEFPVGRSPSAAKLTGDSKHSPKPVASIPNEDADSFEILVDEEILELEPEDSVVDDDDDDA